ncbi:aminotransferase class I/II-fold pyridoxal phosphate-dependent enzyme [Peptococcaceae bacterium 1198_IL3148]
MIKLNQKETPLISALLNYVKKGHVGLHVPGHRQGVAIPEEMANLKNEIFQYDLTELPGLDDLHHPEEAIAKAQTLAAQLYGCRNSYFMVNGTSGGLAALVLACCGPNDEIIIPRNVHRSILTGLILSGAKPVYIYPPALTGFGFTTVPSGQQLNHCICQHPGARAVLMVHPTYYGVTGNLSEIADITHRAGLPLLVDEAHGAHLRFFDQLPADALQCGADAVVQSTHKVGGALTQASMLHLNSDRVDQTRLEACLKMMQTTSPSYLLMASLDAARRQLAESGQRLIKQSYETARYLRAKLKALPGIEVLEKHHLNDTLAMDETRLVINTSKIGLTGYQVFDLLSAAGVQVEMADYHNIVAVLGLNADKGAGQSLYNGLLKIVKKYSGQKLLDATLNPPEAVVMVTPREAWLAKTLRIPLEQAVGKVCGDSISVYPPGIPAVCPGELITQELLEYLLAVRTHKLHIQCSGDATLKTITVVDCGV